jgi:predicted nucleotidyltransferase component of viral defense system
MYKLLNNPILYPHQVKILNKFFQSVFAAPFFLTGGTALSAFYLAHRESQDLDFFSLEKYDTLLLRNTIQELANEMESDITFSIKSQTYNEIFIENKNKEWKQKIDIVQEQPKHFGEITTINNVRVDSLVNIATNKILAIFGRLEPKDYIDLYIILEKTDFTFDELFKLAKEKDTGLSEFYFANTIADVEQFKNLPDMKIKFEKSHFTKFYKDLSRKLLIKIKPLR